MYLNREQIEQAATDLATSYPTLNVEVYDAFIAGAEYGCNSRQQEIDELQGKLDQVITLGCKIVDYLKIKDNE